MKAKTKVIEAEDFNFYVKVCYENNAGLHVKELVVKSQQFSTDLCSKILEGWSLSYFPDGLCHPGHKIIQTGSLEWRTPSTFVAEVLHEIGHSIDFSIKSNQEIELLIKQNEDYGNLSIFHPSEDIIPIINAEQAAWEYSLNQLLDLGIQVHYDRELTYFIFENAITVYAAAHISSELQNVLCEDRDKFRKEIIKKQNKWVKKVSPLLDYDLERFFKDKPVVNFIEQKELEKAREEKERILARKKLGLPI